MAENNGGVGVSSGALLGGALEDASSSLLGGEDGGGGLGFGDDDAERLRVMVFSPRAMKEDISGTGGVRETALSSVGFSPGRFNFDSRRLRFLLLFPLDLGTWLARCCPMGESSLQDIKLSMCTQVLEWEQRIPTCIAAPGWFLGLVMIPVACDESVCARWQR